MDNEYNKPVETTGETNTIESAPTSQPVYDQPYNNVNNTNAQKPKNNKVLLALIVSVLLIAGAATGLAIYMMNNKGNNNGGTSEQQPAAEPLEITDSVKESIYEKLANINQTSTSSDAKKLFVKDGNFRTTAFIFSYIPQLYKNEGYTDTQKLYTLLSVEHFDKKEFKKVGEKYTATDFQKYLNESVVYANWDQFKEVVEYIPAETVEEFYDEVFGEQVKHESFDDVCPGFIYDSDLGVYLINVKPGCGGYDYRSALLRAYNWESSADEYYVDVNVATVYTFEGIGMCSIYSGIEEDILGDNDVPNSNLTAYNTCTFNSKGSTDYLLTENDVDGIAKYRYTFDKDFHFVSIEKL